MAKVTLESIASGYNLSKINSNFQTLETILNDRVLFRDNFPGEPNSMQEDIDANAFTFNNLRDATNAQQPVTLSQLQDAVVSGISTTADYSVTGDWTFGGATNVSDLGVNVLVTGSSALGEIEYYQNGDPSTVIGSVGFNGTGTDVFSVENNLGGIINFVASDLQLNGGPIGLDGGGTETISGTWNFSTAPYVDNNVFYQAENNSATGKANLAGLDNFNFLLLGDAGYQLYLVGNNGVVNIRGDAASLADSRIEFNNNFNTTFGYTGYSTGSNTLELKNSISGGDIDLVTTGAGQVLVNGSPIGGGGSLLIPYLSFLQNTDSFSVDQDVLGITSANNWVRLGYDGTGNQGTCFTGSNEFWIKGNTSSAAMTAQVKFFSDSAGNPGTQRGYVGYPGSNVLTINNTANVGADVNVATSGSGELTSNGVPVAFRNLQISTISGSDSSFGDAEDFASYTGTGGDTWTMGTGMPVGRRVDCVNNGSGALTIDPGVSRTLHWFNGSAVVTGNRTIAVGSGFSIVKYDATNYYITGSGIS